MSRPTPIEVAHYKKLVGRRIEGIQWESFEGRPLPVLILSGKDAEGHRASAVIMCDPEGNGPEVRITTAEGRHTAKAAMDAPSSRR